MSNHIYRVSYLGAPIDHQGIFICTSGGEFFLHHVVGSKVSGFTYRVDPKGGIFRGSANFVQGSEKYLGTCSDEILVNILQYFSTLYVDTQEKSLNEARRSTWNCVNWTDAAEEIVMNHLTQLDNNNSRTNNVCQYCGYSLEDYDHSNCGYDYR